MFETPKEIFELLNYWSHIMRCYMTLIPKLANHTDVTLDLSENERHRGQYPLTPFQLTRSNANSLRIIILRD